MDGCRQSDGSRILSNAQAQQKILKVRRALDGITIFIGHFQSKISIRRQSNRNPRRHKLMRFSKEEVPVRSRDKQKGS